MKDNTYNRELFLKGYKKRFTLIENFFTKEEMLNRSPSLLLGETLTRLDIQRDQINYRQTYNDFWRWISRWRQKHKPSKTLTNSGDRPENMRISKEKISVKGFEFSNPEDEKINSAKDSLINFVTQ
jgi:hypothetical protein